MFWRRSKAELQPIEEAEEKEGDTMELRTLASGSTMAGLPSGAVVVDVEGGGAEGGGPASTAGGSQGGSGPSRVPSIAADIPLLEHSPPSIAIRPPPHKRTPPASPSPAATPLARPAVLQSQASLPTGKPPLPAPSPRPPSKLERLRSQALEAARDEVLGKGGHGQGVSRGSAGTEVANLGRRLSSESERAAAMRRPSLGRDWRTPEGTMHGPGSTVHGGMGGTMHGSGSVGGTVHAGVAVGVASREASAAGGATARVTFGRAGPIKRSTSLQSHKSLAPGGKAAAAAAPAVEPVPTKASGWWGWVGLGVKQPDGSALRPWLRSAGKPHQRPANVTSHPNLFSNPTSSQRRLPFAPPPARYRSPCSSTPTPLAATRPASSCRWR